MCWWSDGYILAGCILETEIWLHQSCDGSWVASSTNFLLWAGLFLFVLYYHFLAGCRSRSLMTLALPYFFFSWVMVGFNSHTHFYLLNLKSFSHHACFRATLTNGGSQVASGTINSLELLALHPCTFGVDLGMYFHLLSLPNSWLLCFCISSF
jgi:hypothetical protein